MVAYLLNQSHRRGKDDAYALLGLPYQVTQLMYKQYSNVVVPQPVPK